MEIAQPGRETLRIVQTMADGFANGGQEIAGGARQALLRLDPAARRASGERGRIGRMRAVFRFCRFAAIVLLVGFAAGFFAFVSSLRDYGGEAAPGEAQGIVALTGGTQRISDAIDLLARGYGQRLLISGVNETTTRAEIAKLNPGQLSLLECCVDLDRRARNTIGNAIETRRWVGEREFSSIIVVTSNYHMPRTMLELDNAMPGVRKIPHAVSPTGVDVDNWWRDPVAARLLGQEYVKYLTVWLRTSLEGDPELSRMAAFFRGADEPAAPGQAGEPEARSAVSPAAIPD